MKILLGVCGSIAGVKTPLWKAQLEAAGHEIKLVLTGGAQSIFSTKPWAKTTVSWGHEKGFEHMSHINLARWADAILVLGATANTLAQVAHGHAADLLQTTILAYDGPVFLAPAMNPTMWHQPSVQRNIALLQADGRLFLGPVEGCTACGDVGLGRMIDIKKVVIELDYLEKMCKTLSGKTVVITAGAAQVDVDPVRVLTNRSSGRMGMALAQVARMAGANVTWLQSGRNWRTNTELETALKNIKKTDYILHTAALSDFKVEKKYHKIPSGATQNIALTSTEKTLPKLKTWFPHAEIYAWKLDTDPARSRAKATEMLDQKWCNGVIINTPETLGGDTCGAVTLVTKQGFTPLTGTTKTALAHSIWHVILA